MPNTIVVAMNLALVDASATTRLGVRKIGAPALMGVAWAKPRALKCFSVPLATVFNEISELSLISPYCVAFTVPVR